MNVYLIASASVNPVTELSAGNLPEAVALSEGNRRTAIEPDYKTLIPDSNIRRRMSRVVKMGVVAAMQCLSQTRLQPGAIITATGLGCLADTERFMKSILENAEQLLNPTPFIQSTFNTIGAQTAIILNNTGYNITYVHHGFAFESALIDALMKIRDREAAQVLVESYDEHTDTSFEIMRRLAFWRRGEVCGEGVQCFMLSAQPRTSGDPLLKDVLCVFGNDLQTLGEKLHLFLRKHSLSPDNVDVLLSGRNGNGCEYAGYQFIEGFFKTAPVAVYKPFFGDYPTVSSMALWLAMRLTAQQQIPRWLCPGAACTKEIKRILIYNNYKGKNHSFLLVEKEP